MTVTLWKHSPVLSEEKRVRTGERELARHRGIGHDVSVAQLGQNHFERLAESVQHANRVLQRKDRVVERSVVMAFIRDKRKLRLRVLGMDQECRAPVDVGAQQAQAFVGGVPRLDHDEVQFVAQKVFDHALIARLDFEEIGEHAGGSVSSLHRARLKKPPHRLGGITVLGDDRFERSLLAQRRGVFGADGVEVLLGFVLGRTLALEGLTQARDLGGQAAGALRNAFEFQSNLAALSAEGFRLRRGGCDLGSQTLLLAADARQPLLGLRELIAEVGSSADRLQNRRAMRFLLLFEHREIGGCAGRFLLAER